MPSWRFVTGRVLFALFAIYLVVSLMFAFLVFVPDPQRANTAWGAAMNNESTEEAISAYNALRGRDEPLLDRYVEWLVGVTTLDFDGGDRRAPDDVMGAVWKHSRLTLVYLLPSIVLSTLLGLLIGSFIGLSNNRWIDAVGSRAVYLLGSIPVFFSLAVADGLFRQNMRVIEAYNPDLPPLAGDNAVYVGIAILTLTVSLAAVQMRYARSEVLSYSTGEMMKLVTAKGGGRGEQLRHAGRLAALPLLSLFFSETLAAMYLAIYIIEVSFGIPGFGRFMYSAIDSRTFGVILAGTVVTIVVGVFGNLLQDVLYTVLDPRVDE